MVDIVKHLSGNRIIGDLIAREKYSFVDGKLIASIVDDVIAIIKEAAAKQEKPPVASRNRRITKPASCEECQRNYASIACSTCGVWLLNKQRQAS